MRLVESRKLADHLHYLVDVLCPGGALDRIETLRELTASSDSEADVSCFWYGNAGVASPAIPTFAKQVFSRLGARIETDFHTDAAP